MNDEMILEYNEATGCWGARKEPYITIEVQTEEDFEFIQKAIKKQEQTFVTCPKGFQGVRDTRYYCPSCGKATRQLEAYCHHCGQAVKYPKVKYVAEDNKNVLDWSED